jgi:hypothetical protein
MRLIRSRFIRSFVFRAAFYVLSFALFAALPLTAAEFSSRTLNSDWQFRAIGDTGNSNAKQWHPAQVPGVVHTDARIGRLETA